MSRQLPKRSRSESTSAVAYNTLVELQRARAHRWSAAGREALRRAGVKRKSASQRAAEAAEVSAYLSRVPTPRFVDE